MKKALAVVSLALLFSIAAFGQAAGLGSITGTVTDASGSPVPGAKVVVSNSEKGISRELTTTGAGIFSAPALTPSGGYKVTVNQPGFAPYEATDIVLQVGATVDLHVALKVGAVTEKVDVSAEAIAISDTKTEISSVVNNQMINDLPINGRRRFNGKIVVVEGNDVTIEQDGEPVRIAHSNIHKARLVPDFGEMGKGSKGKKAKGKK